MKRIKKIPEPNPNTEKKLLQSGWQRLREPRSLKLAIALALPIGFVLMALAAWWTAWLFPQSVRFLKELQVTITLVFWLVAYIFGTFGYLFLHEMLHAAAVPGGLRSKKTYWGLNGFFGFVYSEEEISKARYIVVTLLPLLLLSFAVPLACWLLGWYSDYLWFLWIINAGGACVDVLNVILIACQVPRGGLTRSNGAQTFYRPSN